MKYQKAKSVIHQHTVAKERLQELERTLNVAKEELHQLEVLPAFVEEQIRLLHLEHEHLKERVESCARQLTEAKAKLRGIDAQSSLKIAKVNLTKAQRSYEGQLSVVERFERDLAEARKRVEEIEARDKARKEADAQMPAEVREKVERQRAVKEAYTSGKRVPPGRLDTMGNEVETPISPLRGL